MVLFDANFILLLIHPGLPAPIDPNTGQPVTECQARIQYLVDQLQKAKDKIIIPTPALSEFLVNADKASSAYLAQLSKSPVFRVEPFDERAAIELAIMTADAIRKGDKKLGSTDTWNKIKYDRQIVSIATVCNASVIYTNDKNLRNTAIAKGILVKGVHELDLPPKDAQITIWEHTGEKEPTKTNKY